METTCTHPKNIMIPIAILMIILGGIALFGAAMLLGRMDRLERRLETAEREQAVLVEMISNAIIGQSDRDSLELKFRTLLAGRDAERDGG